MRNMRFRYCKEVCDNAKLLDITIDENLAFKIILGNLRKNAGQKLHTPAGLSIFMEVGKLKHLMSTFITLL